MVYSFVPVVVCQWEDVEADLEYPVSLAPVPEVRVVVGRKVERKGVRSGSNQ